MNILNMYVLQCILCASERNFFQIGHFTKQLLLLLLLHDGWVDELMKLWSCPVPTYLLHDGGGRVVEVVQEVVQDEHDTRQRERYQLQQATAASTNTRRCHRIHSTTNVIHQICIVLFTRRWDVHGECARVCECACVCVCVCLCMRACVCVCVCVHA